MRCPKCGYENEEGAETCKACGADFKQIENEKRAILIKEIKRMQFNFVSSRIILVASFLSLILLIISLCLPAIHLPSVPTRLDIGGILWFTKEGFESLRNGEITVGPFFTTFIIYILVFIITILCSVFALNSIFKTFAKRGTFKGIQYILIGIIANAFYQGVLNAFNYHYEFINNSLYASSELIGAILFDIASFIFLIPLCVHIIGNNMFMGKKENKQLVYFATIIGFFLLRNYDNFFTTIGVINYGSNMLLVEGLFKYFDRSSITYGMNMQTAIPLIFCIIFAGILLLIALFSFLYTTYSFYKRAEINAKRYFILATVNTTSFVGYLVSGIFFSINLNTNQGFYDNYFYINSFLIITAAIVILMQVFAAIGYYKSKQNNVTTSTTIN